MKPSSQAAVNLLVQVLLNWRDCPREAEATDSLHTSIKDKKAMVDRSHVLMLGALAFVGSHLYGTLAIPMSMPSPYWDVEV
jgi:hypothetical protein